MRILHLVHQYPPERLGGTEIYTAALARRQAEQGHAVAVFTRAPGERPDLHCEPAEGVRVYRWRSLPTSPVDELRTLFADRALERAFAAILREERPEIVHVQHLKGLPAGLVRRAREAGARVVLTAHDYWLICANAQLLTNTDATLCDGPRLWLNCARCAAARMGTPALGRLAPLGAIPFAARARSLGAMIRHADRLIAPSRFVAARLARHALPAERIAVIPHGIELPTYPLPRVPRSGPLRVTYLGGLAWQKGVHVLVEAAASLDPARVRVTIFGDETAFPDYVAELRAQARPETIRFAGRLERGALWQTLAATDLLAVPSLWHETAGLVVQEAFAADVPVLASDIGALPEAVHHDRNGLLLPPGDPAAWRRALLALADDPDRLERLRAGIGPVRSLAQHAAEIESLYLLVTNPEEKLLDPRPGL